MADDIHKVDKEFLKKIKETETGSGKFFYKQHKRAVDEVVNYLNHRKYVDGTLRHENKETPKYNWWGFKHYIATCMLREINNYFGCVYDKDGLRGDSIFTEFYIAYSAYPREFWMYNTPANYKIKRAYADCYLEPSEKHWDWFLKNTLTQNKMAEQLKLNEAALAAGTATPMGYWESYRDELFINRQLTMEAHFSWPRESKSEHKKKVKKRKRQKSKDLNKTFQSELAIQKIVKAPIFQDKDGSDRIQMSFMGAVDHNEPFSKPYIMVWDHKLRREHIYLKVGTNDMDHKNSIYKGAVEVTNEIDDITENKLNLKDPLLCPIIDNPDPYDAMFVPKEMDLRSGGYLEYGGPHGDTLPAILMFSEFIFSRRAMIAIGKGSTFRAGKILTQYMRQKEFEAILYEQQSDPKIGREED